MNLNSNDIERGEILHRYFREELSADERAEVEEWRDSEQQNHQEFDAARMMYLDLKGLVFYEKTNLYEVDRSWENFKEKENIRPIHQAPTPRFTILKYAASIALLISVVAAIYWNKTSVERTLLAAQDHVKEITLPDGSVVALNQNSSIEYFEPFQNNERRIKLLGEAYFEVTKEADRPFVVEVGETEMRVLGTKFFIHQPSRNEISVQVDEGKVLVSHEDIHQIAEAGQQLTLNLQEEVIAETTDETGLSSFWKNRILVFQVTPIEEVVATINKAYGKSIQLQGSTEGCLLTVTFDNEDIENVLEVISSTLNYEILENQETLILKGTGCE